MHQRRVFLDEDGVGNRKTRLTVRGLIEVRDGFAAYLTLPGPRHLPCARDSR